MDVIDTLLTRVSVSALQDPAPTGAVLDRILETGLRAPDHGRLAPWRFVLIRGAARAALAEVVAQAMQARDPAAPPEAAAKQGAKFLRAPLVIALGARIRPDHKIPEREQLMSVAAATMNLLNAVHAEGFGAVWVTGANAADLRVQAALGIQPPDTLAGFLFVGTPTTPPMPVRRAALADHVVEWTGGLAFCSWNHMQIQE